MKVNELIKKKFVLFVTINFIFSFSQAYSQQIEMILPDVGALIQSTSDYRPAILQGITVNPSHPFTFDFIVDVGDSGLTEQTLKPEAKKMIKYFLTSLTIPETDKWVNLSPYEQNRIIPDNLGLTEMGRDLLVQDYMLKQLSASLMFPEESIGEKFWDRVYTRAVELYGHTNVPMNTFNKIWIIPNEAIVYTYGQSAFVGKSYLKVMLEEDYLALEKSLGVQTNLDSAKVSAGITSEVVKNVLIPEIEREVNEGQTFANLRQIYNSMILATWYRQAMKDSVLGKAFTNQSKTNGTHQSNPETNQKIWRQYVESFRTGVYDLIKEEYDPVVKEPVFRKYFSGGVIYDDAILSVQQADLTLISLLDSEKEKYVVRSDMAAMSQKKSPNQMVLEQFLKRSAKKKKEIEEGIDFFQKPFSDLDDFILFLNINEKEYISTNERAIINYYESALLDLLSILKVNKEHQELAKLKSFLIKMEENIKRKNRGSSEVFLKLKKTLEEWSTIVLGVSYNQRMTLSDIQARLDSFENIRLYLDNDFNDILKALGINDEKVLFQVAKDAQNETFGVTSYVNKKEEKVVVFEQAFLDRVSLLNNSYQMLERSVVYILAEGSHENKKIAEYEYARDILKIKSESLALNVEYVYGQILKDIRPEGQRDEKIAAEILYKIKSSLWEIAIHIMNKDIDPTKKIRINENDPQLTGADNEGDIRVAFFGASSNPLHLGHIETVLRGMAQLKTSTGVFIVHGIDYRKPPLEKLQEHRFSMAEGYLKYLGLDQFLRSTNISKNTPYDAERNTLRILELNENRQGSIEAVMPMGADHGHYFAPDYKGVTSNDGRALYPKMDRNNLQPDSIQKYYYGQQGKDYPNDAFEAFFDRVGSDFLTRNNFSYKVYFSVRDVHDAKPLPVEEDLMAELKDQGVYDYLRLLSVKKASSTSIREFINQGQKSSLNVTHFSKYYQREINSRPHYRGVLVRLPESILRISNSESADDIPEDIQKFREWIRFERAQDRAVNLQVLIEYFEGEIVEGEFIGEYVSKENIKKAFQIVVDIFDAAEIAQLSHRVGAADKNQKYSLAVKKQSNSVQSYGGINLNEQLMNLTIEMDDNGMLIPVDPAMIQNIQDNVSGFTPVIQNIRLLPSGVMGYLSALENGQSPYAESEPTEDDWKDFELSSLGIDPKSKV